MIGVSTAWGVVLKVCYSRKGENPCSRIPQDGNYLSFPLLQTGSRGKAWVKVSQYLLFEGNTEMAQDKLCKQRRGLYKKLLYQQVQTLPRLSFVVSWIRATRAIINNK